MRLPFLNTAPGYDEELRNAVFFERGLQAVPVQPLHPRGRGRRPAAAQGLAPADVTAIELGVATPVLRTIAELPEARARPASGYHAAFSGPYMVAAALLGGGLGMSHEDFTDAAARDLRRLALPPWCAASRTSAA